jgi:L-ascorbate metabolism protein UlaG (beta-lactamase superfamily)
MQNCAVQRALNMASLETTLTLIGGPTVLIELGGLRLLTDPTFDEPGEYEARGIVLEKKSGPALSADELGVFDAVLLRHDQHFDNLDRMGREVMQRAKNTFTTPVGAKRLGGSATGLIPWETVHFDGSNGQRLYITGTPARHGPVGIEPIAGEVTSFLLGLNEPGDAIYVTGDTVWYEGVAEVARRFEPRLVMLFAGSAKPRGPFHLTMDSNDAMETAHAFAQAKMVAIHNEGWGHFTESQADVIRAFGTLGLAARLQTLERGRPTQILL